VYASKDGVEKYPTPETSRNPPLGDVYLASREKGRSMSFRADDAVQVKPEEPDPMVFVGASPAQSSTSLPFERGSDGRDDDG
jgi:hypothetical protein